MVLYRWHVIWSLDSVPDWVVVDLGEHQRKLVLGVYGLLGYYTIQRLPFARRGTTTLLASEDCRYRVLKNKVSNLQECIRKILI